MTKQTIYTDDAFILDVQSTSHASGTTVELFTTWPKANHPEPHKKLSLTLPMPAYAELGRFFNQLAEQ